jgi:Putative beta-barrel porin-2, OmpL-like. bbp2
VGVIQGPHGQAWADTGVKLYGWVNVGGNLSTSHNTAAGQAANFPVIYDERPNRVELDQAVLYIERMPDEAQTEHVDWGFRVSALYGSDYRFMISRGLFSNQLLIANNFYGYDMPMIYADVYIPWVAQGMNIRIGRIISEADIEAQLAPNNLMYSHSLLYSFDPYTQEGIFTTTKLNDQWIVQAGLANGNDVAIWQDDRGNTPTGTVMVQYISKNNKFSFYGGANSFNNGQFGYNNLQQYVGTFSYKFNEKIWTTHETWYMYQHDAVTAPTATVPFNNAFYPKKPGYAPEWATVNYTMFRLGAATFLTVRNEVFDDIAGQRTGFASVYSENAVGITWWPNKILTLRPEIRYDHSYAVPAYNNGTAHNQVTLAADVIWRF